jgi:hypothetical protein
MQPRSTSNETPCSSRRRSSVQISAASCAPAEWPPTKMRFGSPPYSAGQHVHRDLGEQAVVRRDEDEAALGEHFRFEGDVALVADLPTAAVDPEQDGQAVPGRFLGCVDVEDVPLVAVLDVGDVAVHLLGAGGAAGDEQGEDECNGEWTAHGGDLRGARTNER